MQTNIKTYFKTNTLWVFITIIFLFFIFWFSFTNEAKQNQTFIFTVITMAFGVLGFTLTRVMHFESLKLKFRYRIAFFISGFVSLCSIFIFAKFQASEFHWGLFITMLLASFIGNFLAAIHQRGWMENNAPPSPEIERDVINWHKPIMRLEVNSVRGKRLFDIIFSLIALLISLPLWFLIIILMWWEDPGPILFVKNAVGKGGVNFKQYKFRSMVIDAEKDTGPISGYENDERVLFFGKILRKTALDELPQLINIFFGDMSWVGPRPQRTVLVHKYLQNLPEYAQRHRIRPGLAGLAQVADTYEITPEAKLAWDLVYIEKASLWLDIKLLASAFYLVFALRWIPNTNPELKIRSLLKVEKPQL